LLAKAAVLLIDDEKVILDSLRLQISRFQLDVNIECATSVSEAWELIDELHEDNIDILLIISDWLMPVTRGDAFFEEVKNRFPNIKRILLTGQADYEALERIRSRNLVDKLMAKPWSDADIVEVLAMLPTH
jgi:CheY-like chemotaxis protein